MIEPKSDTEFARWVQKHPSGFVVNTRPTPDPQYMVLHKATCMSISPAKKGISKGAYTEHGYRKICAERIEELQTWVQRHGRSNGTFSKRCTICGA